VSSNFLNHKMRFLVFQSFSTNFRSIFSRESEKLSKVCVGCVCVGGTVHGEDDRI
jgi:hypothetical protein